MTPDRLATLLQFARSFDLETDRIQAGLSAPPPVCGSVAWWNGTEIVGALLTEEQALDTLLSFLADERIVIVGQNLAFDLLVMAVYAARTRGLDLFPAIFAAYSAGRIYDIAVAAQLNAIGHGHLGNDPRTGAPLRDPVTNELASYRLSVLVWLYLARKDAKAADRFRESYALLRGLPFHLWPLEAQTYPVDDACNALHVCFAQVGLMPRVTVHRWHVNHESQPACSACGNVDVMDVYCHRTETDLNLHDLSRQTFAAWCLHLGAAWGFRVDPVQIAKLEAQCALVLPDGSHTDRWHARQRFVEAGIIRGDGVKGKKPGSEDQSLLKKLVAIAYGATAACCTCTGTGKVESQKTGKPVNCAACSGTGLDYADVAMPTTDTGQVGKGRDVLSESGDELLMEYAAFKEDAKIESTYLPWLRRGVAEDGSLIPLTLRPNVLLDTGRTSYGDVVQLLPREGGVREGVVARPGKVLGSIDYEAGELITHAQSCIWIVGYSMLAEQLLGGIKPHNALAAKVLGISYEEYQRRFKSGDKQAIDVRQAAKPPNFGYPGRMGPWKLVLQQRKQGPDTPHPDGPTWIKGEKGGPRVRGYKGLRFCVLMGEAKRCGEMMVTTYGKQEGPPTCLACIKAAARLKSDWLATFPENNAYFQHVQQIENSPDPVVIQHVSQRIRRGMTGNSIANGYFQALLAEAAKNALIRIVTECYVDRSSPLYGGRVIVFQHDEVIPEVDESTCHESLGRVGTIMIEDLQACCPDLAPIVDAKPAAMRRWLKGAQPAFDASGRLIPWEPKS